MRESPHLAPHFAREMTVPAFAVAVSSLVLLFLLGSLKKVKLLKVIPPPRLTVWSTSSRRTSSG